MMSMLKKIVLFPISLFVAFLALMANADFLTGEQNRKH